MAHDVRRQQVSGADRDQVRRAAVEPRPVRLRPRRAAARRRPGRRREHHRPGPGQRADVPRPDRHRGRVAGLGRSREPVAARGDHRGDRPARRSSARPPPSPRRSNDFVQSDASDGFILVPHITPGGLDEFVDTVVPLLQERGVFRTEYDGHDAARPSRPGAAAQPGPPGHRPPVRSRAWPPPRSACSTWCRSARARPRPRRCVTASTWPGTRSGSATRGTGSPSTT